MAKKRNFTAEVAELEQKLFDPRGGRSRRTCHEEGAALHKEPPLGDVGVDRPVTLTRSSFLPPS